MTIKGAPPTNPNLVALKATFQHITSELYKSEHNNQEPTEDELKAYARTLYDDKTWNEIYQGDLSKLNDIQETSPNNNQAPGKRGWEKALSVSEEVLLDAVFSRLCSRIEDPEKQIDIVEALPTEDRVKERLRAKIQEARAPELPLQKGLQQ